MYGMADASIEPPNSRLFILCSKSLTEADLHEAFDQFGTVEDIWILKDRTSNESKGVAYIKYSKSSEAALAMEEMNGKTIGNTASKPIKVMIAHSREQGSKKEDDPERLLRLFIVVPKTMTEEEIRDHFKQFGDIDYVSIVKNRDTGGSKGVGYVKYLRAYHAAKAYEECSRSYKAVFARPREPKQSQQQSAHDMQMDRMGGNWGGYNDSISPRGGGGGVGVYGDSRLLAFVPSSLRQEQVYRLFDIAPGLLDIRPQANSQRNSYYQAQKVLVEYNCPQAASYAADKLHGFEYPPGQRITIRPASGEIPPPGRLALLPSSPVTPRMEVNGSGLTTISTTELATLNAALAKAEAIIKNQGLAPSGLKSDDSNTFDPTYCSVRLPPPQPLVPPPEGPTHRLFIVCQPGLPSMYALRDIFGRFGNLVEVYTLHGKNCGYVTYATKKSADDAIKTLHLQEVCGMRMKVMVADPPRGGPDRSDRKRLRIDTESTES